MINLIYFLQGIITLSSIELFISFYFFNLFLKIIFVFFISSMILHQHPPLGTNLHSFDYFQPISPFKSSTTTEFLSKLNVSFYGNSSIAAESSFNSSQNTDSSLSDDSKEEVITPQKSKYQMTLERRHRNFEVKKKTEVIILYETLF